jgi:hypothetical protein
MKSPNLVKFLAAIALFVLGSRLSLLGLSVLTQGSVADSLTTFRKNEGSKVFNLVNGPRLVSPVGWTQIDRIVEVPVSAGREEAEENSVSVERPPFAVEVIRGRSEFAMGNAAKSDESR